MQARHGQKGKLLGATGLDLLVRTSSIALNLLSRFVVLEVRRGLLHFLPSCSQPEEEIKGWGGVGCTPGGLGLSWSPVIA